MQRLIVWLLFLCLLVYNTVDTLQTIILIDLGVGEANDTINYYISLFNSDVKGIAFVKILPLSALGFGLFLYAKDDAING
jgi:hypothetical protein